ncbi:hypothetical protein NEDG_01004 [Nematocida displodere]|uniref:mRNA-decapping enzyme 1B n=1 Tax=Nematocida displodere TaxID=1805483 RepID=A0A177EAC4_9MICR|nr:hypothetical protein NEDG_01004 [Nematocida displodere]
MADTKESSNVIIQRLLTVRDSAFSHLLMTSLHVVLMKFEDHWVKNPIEGSVYVYKRTDIPTTAITILNRKSPCDFQMFLDGAVVDIESHDRFIVIKRAVSSKEIEILGFWFYDSQSAIEMSFILFDQLGLLKRSQKLLTVINQEKKALKVKTKSKK